MKRYSISKRDGEYLSFVIMMRVKDIIINNIVC